MSEPSVFQDCSKFSLRVGTNGPAIIPRRRRGNRGQTAPRRGANAPRRGKHAPRRRANAPSRGANMPPAGGQ
eukprot:461402-Rhodomonas_salina.1